MTPIGEQKNNKSANALLGDAGKNVQSRVQGTYHGRHDGKRHAERIIPFIKINFGFMDIERFGCKAPEGAPDAGNP